MKLLFIDHIYHKSTKSSLFMIDLLKKHFDIDIIFIDPHEKYIEKKINQSGIAKYDLILLWQIDWLAPYFLRLGFKTIVIPMFDGSSKLDSLHWRVARDALFINFSLHLHNIITEAGCNSIYVRYFPPINDVIFPSISNKTSPIKPTAFFWERRPDTILNTSEVCRLLDKSISHLHIHQAPDPEFSPSQIPENLPFTVSTSNWFSCSEQYLECVCSHDIYIAPRYTEGIGMGFLEAMSLGRVVIAHDAPTHNEYIRSNYNGILFNAFRRDVIRESPEKIREIRKKATADSIEMRRSWNFYYKNIIIKRIISYVNEFSNNKLASRNTGYSAQSILKGLVHAHSDWNAYWNFLKKLEEESALATHNNGLMAEVGRLERCGHYGLAKTLLTQKIRSIEQNSPYDLFYQMLSSRISLKNV